jgi:hypothetical protein
MRPSAGAQVSILESEVVGEDPDVVIIDEGACLDKRALQLLFHCGRALFVLLQAVEARSEIPTQDRTNL